MKANSVTGKPHEAAGASSVPATQAGRMRAAVEKTVAIAPGFLRGDVDANRMANTMVHAVRNYVEQEQAAGGDGAPENAEAQALQNTLAELMACGSGFLAGRCDAACVARTMTQMVHEFTTH
ncbi:MAG: hypothetical protein EPN76_00135 [Burkholderiaceae bacterium]|nr:MAG: hypothetical protein EPN76_00135 [Burkholderiaceae bacterium]TAM09698.1 MAG: hypothetical protein EPN67_01390 [Pusillimonas sp.]